MSKKQLIYLLSNKAKTGAKRFNDCNLFKAIATRLYLQPNYENYLCKQYDDDDDGGTLKT